MVQPNHTVKLPAAPADASEIKFLTEGGDWTQLGTANFQEGAGDVAINQTGLQWINSEAKAVYSATTIR